MATFLGWAYVLLPPACWAVLARTRTTGAAVGAVLAGLAAVPVGLEHGWFHSRATAESEAGYPLAAGLVVLAGALVERRRCGPRPSPEYSRPVAVATLATAAHSLIGLVIGLLYQLAVHEPYSPARAEFSLPAGLTVERDSGEDPRCALHFCVRELTLGSPEGLPGSEVGRRVRERLAADGWRPGPNDTLRRRHGWLLDKRVTVLRLDELDRGAVVELVGPDRFSPL
ncbi:hypothetical protein [Kitasatospora sp. NPDC002965]|uniref:hypothetical protein n=1 Tax=Kitasatospora sp. NPDC002965 TaxID=3154775 RepID=UPI0033BBF955